jgi:transposase
MPPIELITRGERRRRWTVEQKQTIAAQSLTPGASATEVARQHGIGTGQLYNWRKALRAAPVPGRFACVEVAPARTRRGGESNLIPAPPPLTPAQPAGLIEIILTTGTTLRVDAQVDPRALRRVLAALRG